MLTYTWKIDNVIVSPSENGLENVIKSVFYSVDVTDASIPKTVTLNGSLALAEPNPITFIEFNQLTSAQ